MLHPLNSISQSLSHQASVWHLRRILATQDAWNMGVASYSYSTGWHQLLAQDAGRRSSLALGMERIQLVLHRSYIRRFSEPSRHGNCIMFDSNAGMPRACDRTSSASRITGGNTAMESQASPFDGLWSSVLPTEAGGTYYKHHKARACVPSGLGFQSSGLAGSQHVPLAVWKACARFVVVFARRKSSVDITTSSGRWQRNCLLGCQAAKIGAGGIQIWPGIECPDSTRIRCADFDRSGHFCDRPRILCD